MTVAAIKTKYLSTKPGLIFLPQGLGFSFHPGICPSNKVALPEADMDFGVWT